jgi:hypothetical protein
MQGHINGKRQAQGPGEKAGNANGSFDDLIILDGTWFSHTD